MTVWYQLGSEANRAGVPESAAEAMPLDSAREWQRGWWDTQQAKWHLEATRAKHEWLRRFSERFPPKPCEPLASMPTLWDRLRRLWGREI